MRDGKNIERRDFRLSLDRHPIATFVTKNTAVARTKVVITENVINPTLVWKIMVLRCFQMNLKILLAGFCDSSLLKQFDDRQASVINVSKFWEK